MAVNVPEVQILVDGERTVIAKVTAYFNGATTSNTKIIQSNATFGANTSRDCILDVESVQYSVSVNAGFISLEHISKVNSNSKIYNFSGRADGILTAPIGNNANTPSGDINLNIVGAAQNDVINLIITMTKNGRNDAFQNVFAAYR